MVMTDSMRHWAIPLLFIARVVGAEPSFQPVILDRSYIAYERDVGDIDSDGDNDVVAVQEGDTALQVFRAPEWTRSRLVTFSGPFRYPRADDLKLADIDGDGDLDVVTRLGAGPSDDGAGIAVWCENQGRGSNFNQRVIGNSLEYVKDIDNDGDLDIVGIRNWNSAPTWICRNQSRNGRALTELVRVIRNSLCDDRGPFLGLGASYFQALRHAKYDRPRLVRNLAFLASRGFNYVHCHPIGNMRKTLDFIDVSRLRVRFWRYTPSHRTQEGQKALFSR